MTRDEMLALLGAADLEQSLPEVAHLHDVPQPPEYHAEGDAFIHTCLAVASLPEDADKRLVWATALHDIGKAETTCFSDGRWRALGHDKQSAELVADILPRFNREDMVDDVYWLVRHHHFAISWLLSEGQKLTPKQTRFCRHLLFPLLVELCRADAAGSRGISEKLIYLERVICALKEAEK
jgi:hypothetical protein